MRSTLLAGFLATLLVACGGDDDPIGPDAGVEPDGSGGGICTGLPYDSCTDTAGGSDCMDGLECRLFMQQGFTVCTPTCDASNPCPDQDGTPVACNNMGRCRGDAANACTLP